MGVNNVFDDKCAFLEVIISYEINEGKKKKKEELLACEMGY